MFSQQLDSESYFNTRDIQEIKFIFNDPSSACVQNILTYCILYPLAAPAVDVKHARIGQNWKLIVFLFIFILQYIEMRESISFGNTL